MMTSHNTQGSIFSGDDGFDETSFADIRVAKVGQAFLPADIVPLAGELDRRGSGLYGLAAPEISIVEGTT